MVIPDLIHKQIRLRCELKSEVDALITIPNQKLLEIADEKMSILEAFKVSDSILNQGVQGISDLTVIATGFDDVNKTPYGIPREKKSTFTIEPKEPKVEPRKTTNMTSRLSYAVNNSLLLE